MNESRPESPRRSGLPELLIRIRRGDEAARRDAIDLLADDAELGATLLRITRKMLPQNHPARNMLDSRDAIQSALATAYTEFPTFRGETEGNLLGWLRSIVRTKISRAAAQAGRRPPEAPVLEESDPAQVVLMKELLDDLHRAIGKLDLDKRLVIELRLRELNSNQAAKILGVKAPAVRKRESRAVQDLRKFMRVDTDEEDGCPTR